MNVARDPVVSPLEKFKSISFLEPHQRWQKAQQTLTLHPNESSDLSPVSDVVIPQWPYHNDNSTH